MDAASVRVGESPMVKVMPLYRGHRFLGGRSVAHRVRRDAEVLLGSNPKAVVILDFSGVEGVSHSFADELLTPLSELLKSTTRERVFLKNCASEVLEELELVATMHDLFMPALAGKDKQPSPTA
jgi:hypothetical protein